MNENLDPTDENFSPEELEELESEYLDWKKDMDILLGDLDGWVLGG